MMGIIKKLHPTDIYFLKYIYGYISSLEKEEYKNFTFETLLECRDNVYIHTCSNNNLCIDGIIVCRRTNMDKIDISKLHYYCQSYRVMYSIEFMHVDEYNDDTVCQNIAKQLLEACAKDKNDAFISIRFFSLDKKLPKYITKDLLYSQNFYMYSYENKIYTFIKSPTIFIKSNN